MSLRRRHSGGRKAGTGAYIRKESGTHTRLSVTEAKPVGGMESEGVFKAKGLNCLSCAIVHL